MDRPVGAAPMIQLVPIEDQTGESCSLSCEDRARKAISTRKRAPIRHPKACILTLDFSAFGTMRNVWCSGHTFNAIFLEQPKRLSSEPFITGTMEKIFRESGVFLLMNYGEDKASYVCISITQNMLCCQQ